jgi:two-component system, LytTR family, response regulator
MIAVCMSGATGYMLRESIGDLSEKLDPHRFVRIHRSSIVNLDRIREINRDGQSEGSIVLTTGATLRMSRSGRQKLMESGRT